MLARETSEAAEDRYRRQWLPFSTPALPLDLWLASCCKTLASFSVTGPRQPSSRSRSAGRPYIARGAVRRDTSTAASHNTALYVRQTSVSRAKVLALALRNDAARASQHLVPHSSAARRRGAIGAANKRSLGERPPRAAHPSARCCATTGTVRVASVAARRPVRYALIKQHVHQVAQQRRLDKVRPSHSQVGAQAVRRPKQYWRRLAPRRV